jgi:hypothetical protein
LVALLHFLALVCALAKNANVLPKALAYPVIPFINVSTKSIIRFKILSPKDLRCKRLGFSPSINLVLHLSMVLFLQINNSLLIFLFCLADKFSSIIIFENAFCCSSFQYLSNAGTISSVSVIKGKFSL